MLFIAACVDKSHSLDKREENRAAHLAYLNGLGAGVKTGGAFSGPDRQIPVGSMIIFEGESEKDILALLDKDPYLRAGLFESVSVTPWRQAVGQALF
jgi:uncharacterized protein